MSGIFLSQILTPPAVLLLPNVSQLVMCWVGAPLEERGANLGCCYCQIALPPPIHYL